MQLASLTLRGRMRFSLEYVFTPGFGSRVINVFSRMRVRVHGLDKRTADSLIGLSVRFVACMSNIQQTASSEVLQVISSSPGELGPVFQTMLANAVRICEAKIGTLYLREGDGFRTVAVHHAPPAYVEARTRELIRLPPDSTLGRVAATKQVIHIADIITFRVTHDFDVSTFF